jgi:hypothetical protein
VPGLTFSLPIDAMFHQITCRTQDRITSGWLTFTNCCWLVMIFQNVNHEKWLPAFNDLAPGSDPLLLLTLFLSLLPSAFAVFTTVPWNHTTKRYQTDLLERHDGTKPGPRCRRDGSDGTIEIEKLGGALVIALFFAFFCICVPLKSRRIGGFKATGRHIYRVDCCTQVELEVTDCLTELQGVRTDLI